MTTTVSLAERFGVPHTYASGVFAPVYDELTSWHLPVTGSIPDELDGVFLRNGPTPPPAAVEGTYHWFVPDGMMHGVKLGRGRAVWYRNRWVRTEALAAKIATAPAGGPDDVALSRTPPTRRLLRTRGVGCSPLPSTACHRRSTRS